jgi:hypothetical protein
VRNEYLGGLEDDARDQPVKIPEIEKKGLLPELEFHVNAGIPERIINQVGIEHKGSENAARKGTSHPTGRCAQRRISGQFTPAG